MLDREELIEQAYFFRVLGERLLGNTPMQELLGSVREEVLATTKLPMAIDFLLAELVHAGLMSTAMVQLSHYFTPFQTYIMAEAESDRSRFDFRVALQILHKEAQYRADEGSRAGLFLYQFESLCRNRLRYDRGLDAMAADPAFDEDWSEWIKTVQRQVGLIDMGDLIFARSEYSLEVRRRQGEQDPKAARPLLFGPREGKIALANQVLGMTMMPNLVDDATDVVKHRGEFEGKTVLLAHAAIGSQRIENRQSELFDMFGMKRIIAKSPAESPGSSEHPRPTLGRFIHRNALVMMRQ